MGAYREYCSSRPEDGNPLKYWYIDTLIELSQKLPTIEVDIEELKELDRVAWYGNNIHHGRLTIRDVVNHTKRIYNADTSIPIILTSEGKLLDGFHRLAKAYLTGLKKLPAKQFIINPEPIDSKDMLSWIYDTYHQ